MKKVLLFVQVFEMCIVFICAILLILAITTETISKETIIINDCSSSFIAEPEEITEQVYKEDFTYMAICPYEEFTNNKYCKGD